MIQEYLGKGTQGIKTALPDWEILHMEDPKTAPDTLVLFDSRVFELARKGHYGQLDLGTGETNDNLKKRYTAVRLTFKAGKTVNPTAGPTFLVLSYHGIKNGLGVTENSKWENAKALVSAVGQEAFKSSIPALIGGDWNTSR